MILRRKLERVQNPSDASTTDQVFECNIPLAFELYPYVGDYKGVLPSAGFGELNLYAMWKDGTALATGTTITNLEANIRCHADLILPTPEFIKNVTGGIYGIQIATATFPVEQASDHFRMELPKGLPIRHMLMSVYDAGVRDGSLISGEMRIEANLETPIETFNTLADLQAINHANIGFEFETGKKVAEGIALWDFTRLSESLTNIQNPRAFDQFDLVCKVKSPTTPAKIRLMIVSLNEPRRPVTGRKRGFKK